MTTNMNVHFEGTIAKPAHLVFAALVDHRKLCKYFITRGSAPLEEGKTVQWVWEDKGAELSVEVKKIVPDQLVQFSWNATGAPSLVSIALKEGANTTTLTITEEGWPADDVAKVVQQSIGWTDFFCSLKAYLLFNVNLRSGKALAPNKAFL